MINLYVKAHDNTGLQYFGRTNSKNVSKYKGSGRYWKNHISKYGNDVSTIVVGQFSENDPMLVEFALGFLQQIA